MTEADKNVQALEEIVRQCALIDERLAMFGRARERFEQESLFQDACAFCLLQIGEAANRLTDEYREKTRDVGWHRVIGMRNIIAHAYGKFDTGIAWETVTEDIPKLKLQVEAQLAEMV